MISEERLDDFVESLLASPANLYYVPDAAERVMYRTAMRLLLEALDQAVASASVSVLGHRITFRLEPLPYPTADETDEERHARGALRSRADWRSASGHHHSPRPHGGRSHHVRRRRRGRA